MKRRIILIVVALIVAFSSFATCFGATGGSKVTDAKGSWKHDPPRRTLTLKKNWKAFSSTRCKSMTVRVYFQERLTSLKPWDKCKNYKRLTIIISDKTLKEKYPKQFYAKYKKNLKTDTIALSKKNCRYKIVVSGKMKKKVKGKWKIVNYRSKTKYVYAE